jgi:hypothetical protein
MAMYFPFFFAAIALLAGLAQYDMCGGGKNLSKRIALLLR